MKYAVGTESMSWATQKLIDPGETVLKRRTEQKEGRVWRAQPDLLKKLQHGALLFSSKMNIVVAEDLYRSRWKATSLKPCRRYAGRWRI